MGSGPQIKPRFLVPPDIGTLRPDVAKLLSTSIAGFNLGNNPFQAPLDPLQSASLQQYQSILEGGQPSGPAGAAAKGLGEQIETGFNIDTSPFVKQAQNTFSRDIAPNIKESLGANYGIRFGTPVAESLSRAGADVSTNLNATLAGYANEAAGRRAEGVKTGLSLPGMAGAAGAGATANRNQGIQQFLQAILGGSGSLSGQAQFANPQFGPNQNMQYAQIAAALIAAMLA